MRQPSSFKFDQEDDRVHDEEEDEEDDEDDDDHYFRSIAPMDPPPHQRTTSSSMSFMKDKRRRRQSSRDGNNDTSKKEKVEPTLEPYAARLERFELFSTRNYYYLVACNKGATQYRIMKMDRTLIETSTTSTSSTFTQKGGGIGSGGSGTNADFPSIVKASSSSSPREGSDVIGIDAIANNNSVAEENDTTIDSQIDYTLVAGSGGGSATSPKMDPPGVSTSTTVSPSNIATIATTTATAGPKDPTAGGFYPTTSSGQIIVSAGGNTVGNNAQQQQQHSQKQTTSSFRQLSDFMFEDPAIYTQQEVRDMLDMINDGNKSSGGMSLEQQAAGGVVGDQSQVVESILTGINPNDERASHLRIGGATTTGLKPICKAYGILGFIRFLDCYYLTLITKRAKVGSIGGNSIYTIKSVETFPLKPAERGKSGTPGSIPSDSSLGTVAAGYSNDPSSMLLSMWNRGKRSVGLGLSNREIAELRYQGLYQVIDLTKNFFFSYTYDLTRSLQENFLGMTSRPSPPRQCKDMYQWNYFLTLELEECTNSITSFNWVLPVVHGAFIQRKLHDYGRSLNLMLLARRSRHFAGTRYLKRGVSDRGKVANDVEHEQILHDESTSPEGVFSSYLQIRGSIPTFWTQESSVTMPKPPIVLNRVDPTYQATQAHFEDLLKRYGSPVIVVDLVKQSEKREREVIVGNEFRNAIDYINQHVDDGHKILYCALDYSHISKHRNLNVSSSLNDVATWSVNQTGFFCSSPQWKIIKGGSIEPFDNDSEKNAEVERLGNKGFGNILFFPMEQMGILRTNCIDCLDRTNVAQFSAGVEALGQQLVVMGIRSSPKLDPSSIVVRMLIDMYVEIGDQIALQYGGSEAHKKVASAGANSNIPGQLGKHKELLTSIRRYYSNAFTDRLKQDAMNLFLGYYLPSQNNIPLWELENDYYLHNFHVNAGRGSLQSMKAYQSMFGVDWSDSEDENCAEKNRVYRNHDSVGLMNINDDLARIDRVKQRCRAQNDALSVWWKLAIQTYIQQRMWMRMNSNPSRSSLPPRFDRLYRPTALTHFDKVFARPWATPSRLSHEDQHKSSLDDGELGSATNLSPRKAAIPNESMITLFDERVQSLGHGGHDETTENDEGCISLQDYVTRHGFNAKNKNSLSQLIEATSTPQYALTAGDPYYLGSLKANCAPPNPMYVDYASNPTMPRRPCQEKRAEFAACLNRVGVGIDSDDVQGIRKLAESAHICQEIQSGPYRGLNENVSAIRVATTIHGHFNYLEEKVEEGELSYNDIHPPELLESLKQTDLYSVGVAEMMYTGWKHLAKAEKSFTEINDMSSIGYRRSDITTESSLKLYSSFFDQSNCNISPLEQAYAIGERLPTDPSKRDKISGQNKDLRSFDEAKFIMKAASRGINICKKSTKNQIDFHTPRPIPTGFEQINEDLFARKDNKFMVFNGAAVDSWKSPPQPETKTKKGIDILVALLEN